MVLLLLPLSKLAEMGDIEGSGPAHWRFLIGVHVRCGEEVETVRARGAVKLDKLVPLAVFTQTCCTGGRAESRRAEQANERQGLVRVATATTPEVNTRVDAVKQKRKEKKRIKTESCRWWLNSRSVLAGPSESSRDNVLASR